MTCVSCDVFVYIYKKAQSPNGPPLHDLTVELICIQNMGSWDTVAVQSLLSYNGQKAAEVAGKGGRGHYPQ